MTTTIPRTEFETWGEVGRSVKPILEHIASEQDQEICSFISETNPTGPTRVKELMVPQGRGRQAQNVIQDWTHSELRRLLSEAQSNNGVVLSRRLPIQESPILRELPGKDVLLIPVYSRDGNSIITTTLLNTGERSSPKIDTKIGRNLQLSMGSPEDSNDVEGIVWSFTASPLSGFVNPLREKLGIAASNTHVRPLVLACHREYSRLRGLRPFAMSEHDSSVMEYLSYVFDLRDIESQWPSELIRTVTIGSVRKEAGLKVNAQIFWTASDPGLPAKVMLEGQLASVKSGDLLKVRVYQKGRKVVSVKPLEILQSSASMKDEEWRRQMNGLPGWGGMNLGAQS